MWVSSVSSEEYFVNHLSTSKLAIEPRRLCFG
jgi:hypothetical protein